MTQIHRRAPCPGSQALVLVPAFVLALAASPLHAQRTWHPTITGAAPSLVQLGSNVTISGTDLNPPGWQARVRCPSRYSGSSTIITNTSVRATSITFAAPEMRDTGMEVEWTIWNDSLASLNPIPLAEQRRAVPATIVVQGPPDITFAGAPVGPDVGPPFQVIALGNGGAVVKGKLLRRTSLPAVTFGGTPLTTLQHTYEQSGTLYALNGSGGGADRLVFAPPTQKQTAWLVVDNSLGRDSALITFTPPPVIQQIRVQDGATTLALAPTNQLQRGRTYVLRGTNLSVIHTAPSGVSVKRGLARLGATDIAPVFASDTNLIFKVPDAFPGSSASLAVVTPAGTSVVGTFVIANQVAAIGVTALSVSSAALVSGQELVLLATLSIPPDTPAEQLGSLRVTVTSGTAAAVRLKSPYPVNKAGPTEVRIQAGDVQSPTALSLLVAHESHASGAGTTTQPLSVTVRPPHPLRMSTGPGVVTAGTTRNFDVQFDGTVGQASGIFALLSSSNPNLVAVPPSVVLNGDKTSFNATIVPMLQPASVTLSVTLDGVSVSLPLNIQLPTVQRVDLSNATAGPGAGMTAVAQLSGALVDERAIAWSISDTAVRFQFLTSGQRPPPQNGVNLEVTPALSAQRNVVVSASYGGTTKSDTVSLVPVLISDFIATPTSGRTGTALSATALLSATPPTTMSMRFTTGDSTYATVASSSNLISGTSKVVSIQLRGAPTSPRQIPITATLSSGNVIVSTRTLVITVMP